MEAGPEGKLQEMLVILIANTAHNPSYRSLRLTAVMVHPYDAPTADNAVVGVPNFFDPAVIAESPVGIRHRLERKSCWVTILRAIPHRWLLSYLVVKLAYAGLAFLDNRGSLRARLDVVCEVAGSCADAKVVGDR